jgi:sporulation protein YlmC with PRC-barrel domain
VLTVRGHSAKPGRRQGATGEGRLVETDLHIGAQAVCTDGPAGKVRYVVVDPNADRITHLVVDVQEHFGFPVLVMRDHIRSASREEVRLDCTRDELRTMDPFQEVLFAAPDRPHEGLGYLPSQYLYPAQGGLIGPLAAPPTLPPVIEDRVPAGDVLIGPDAAVEATDGTVGRVEDVETDPATGRLTHVVVRTGHLWAARSVKLPASAVERVEEGAVHLKVSRDEFDALVRSGPEGEDRPERGAT